jgi:LysM repeat protein
MKTWKHVIACLLPAAALLLWSCAKEGTRTDIALEMTDEDSVEAIIDQDLLTAGGTIVNIEEDAGTRGGQSTVTYVDEVEPQKPVLVQADETLKPYGTEPSTAPGMIVTDESLLPPPVEATAIEEPVFDTTYQPEPGSTLAAQATEPALPEFEPSVPDVDTLLDETVTADTGGVTLTMTESSISVPPPAGFEQPGGGTTPAPGGIQPAAVRPPGGGYYSTPYATMTPPVVYPRHTVVQGDTLWSISKKYNVTISELCAANNVSRRDILRIGQTLLIPRSEEMAGATPPPPLPEGEEGAIEPAAVAPPAADVSGIETEYYTVQQGDSYWKIAQRYGISASELMALNDTSDSLIRTGQKILVPKK